jgi:hypothetical protein
VGSRVGFDRSRDDLHGGECVKDEPTGRDGGRPAYRASTLVSPSMARPCLTWRSMRQKMSRARRMTVTRAAMRRLFLAEQGEDGKGSLEGGADRRWPRRAAHKRAT